MKKGNRAKTMLLMMGLALTAANEKVFNDNLNDIRFAPKNYSGRGYGTSGRNASKCAKHFANKKERNRQRNKAARKSRAINRA